MAYTKHNYQPGEKLYASQLNEMDDQIAKNESEVERLTEEKVDKYFGIENAGDKLVVGEDGYVTAKKNAVVTYRPELEGIWNVYTNEIATSADYWYFRTDLLSLDGVTKIKASFKMGNSGYGVAFFDDAQNIMPSVSIVGDSAGSYKVVEMDVPSGAAYCALSHYGGGRDNAANVSNAYITLYSGDGEEATGLTAEQVSALNEMFKVCAYVASADSAYAAFRAAFGITDGVNVYFADYSEWPKWGAGISVVDNGFSVNSSDANVISGIAVGILQAGKYGDYKDKTLKISCDVAGEIPSDATIPFYLRTYTDVPESSYEDKAVAFIRGPYVNSAKHVEWTVTPSTATWENGTPNDTDYLALQFYFEFVGEATITNFTIEVV